MRVCEPASFSRENVIAVVILLRQRRAQDLSLHNKTSGQVVFVNGKKPWCSCFRAWLWRFASTKTFENLETAANGTEFSRKSFQKFRKQLNFRNQNNSTENSSFPRAKLNGKKTSAKTFENLGILCEVTLFLEILENAPPFAPGSWRKFKPDVLVEWKALFVSSS